MSLGVLLNDLIDELKHLNEDSFEDLMQVLVCVALSDGELKPSESSTLVELGISMGLSPQKTLAIITREIGRENFWRKEFLLKSVKFFHPAKFFIQVLTRKKIKLAENPKTGIEQLFKLGRDLSFDVRAAVLFNPSTPDELRMEILDSSPAILERTLAKLD